MHQMNIAVVYLYREHTAVNSFMESYANHRAFYPHSFVVLAKGAVDLAPLHRSWVNAIAKRSDFGRDLDAYGAFARRYDIFTHFCFFNSWTVILKDGWLNSMAGLLSRNELVGCSSSTQSFYSNRPTWWRKCLFPPTPNWHIRTNGFLIERDLMLKIWPRFILCKKLAYLFESGWRSMTRRAADLGAIPAALDDLNLIRDNHVCEQ